VVSSLPTDGFLPRRELPRTIEEWKAVAEGLLTPEACAFRRNLEISARYAWVYGLMPECFKWAGMAAIASHHVRLALFPLKLDADSAGRVDIQRSLGRHKYLLLNDVNTIRTTNNAIFDDVFWAHLAYTSAEDGINRLRALLGAQPHYAPVLGGFESIDEGRRVLEDGAASALARRVAEDLIWHGNLQLLAHEQRTMVQPSFDRLSCLFARVVSMGSATTFEVRGLRQEAAYFTSFYGFSLGRGMTRAVRTKSWPRITRYEDRWRWLVSSVVPRFRLFEADARTISLSLRRILDGERAAAPCPRPGALLVDCPCQPAPRSRTWSRPTGTAARDLTRGSPHLLRESTPAHQLSPPTPTR